MNKLILDLCGGTGSWSKPYAEAGYKVLNITLPEYDILRTTINYNPRGNEIWFRGNDDQESPKTIVKVKNVHGILAAPPCTQFSFARTNAKAKRDLRGGMGIVQACLDVIWSCVYSLDSDQQKYSPLKFWALENPYFGMLRWFLGKPAFVFNPWEFGDAYKKRTALWGHFKEPQKTNFIEPKVKKFDYLPTKEIHPEFYGKYDRQTRRAITPQGFAKAFFEVNK